MSGVNINPMVPTVAPGTFFASSDGYVAGTLRQDAPSRFKIRGGVINPATSAAYIYGGVGVSSIIPSNAAGGLSAQFGAVLDLAANLAALAGFAVFDQSAAGIQTPQSPVPLYAGSMGLNFVEFGSGAQIVLPISATNAAALLSVADSTALSWDYANQVVIPYTNSGGNAGAIPGPAWNATVSLRVARILDVQVGNSKLPATHTNYAAIGASDPGAGLTSWYDSGCVVVLEI